jgi:O-antigen ligase
MILAGAALLALDRGLSSTTPRTRILWAAATLWLASGLVANLGRSGQIAFAIGATVLVAVSVAGRSRRAAAIAVLALWALGVGLVLALPRVGDRLLEARDEIRAAAVAGDFQSNQGRRLAAAIVTSEMVRERPLLGFGIGGAMPRFRALLDERHPGLADLVRWFPHLHNQYLQVAAELGALGLVTLAVMLWQIGRLRDPGSATPNLGLLVAVAYAVGFLGDPYLHKQIPLATFALLAGLATSAPEPDAPPE